MIAKFLFFVKRIARQEGQKIIKNEEEAGVIFEYKQKTLQIETPLIPIIESAALRLSLMNYIL